MSAHHDKRLPRPTPLTEPWWEACRREELLIQKCRSCEQHQFYPRALCASCGAGELDWVRAAGRGRVESYTVVRLPVSKAYAPEVPFVIALVRLEEGPVMMASLVDAEVGEVAVGMEVGVVFEQWTDEVTVPKFRPAGG